MKPHHIRVKPHHIVTKPHNDNTTSHNSETTSHNDKTTSRNHETTSHDKKPHKKVTVFHTIEWPLTVDVDRKRGDPKTRSSPSFPSGFSNSCNIQGDVQVYFSGISVYITGLITKTDFILPNFLHSWELNGKFSHYWGRPGTRNSFFGIILGSSCLPASYKWVFIGKYTGLFLQSQLWESTVNISQNWGKKKREQGPKLFPALRIKWEHFPNVFPDSRINWKHFPSYFQT